MKNSIYSLPRTRLYTDFPSTFRLCIDIAFQSPTNVTTSSSSCMVGTLNEIAFRRRLWFCFASADSEARGWSGFSKDSLC